MTTPYETDEEQGADICKQMRIRELNDAFRTEPLSVLSVSLRWRPPGNDLAFGDSSLRSGSMIVSTI